MIEESAEERKRRNWPEVSRHWREEALAGIQELEEQIEQRRALLGVLDLLDMAVAKCELD